MVNRCILIAIVLLLTSCISKKSALHFTSDPSTSDSFYIIQQSDSMKLLNSNDYLVRNRFGNWELYLSGNPYQLGNKNGLLTQDLYRNQRRIFMDKLESMVPSKFKQRIVLKFVHWYGRKLDNYIPEEYLSEIYALSTHLDQSYAYAADNFNMTLFMHAAHDLGHALRDLAIVGCTSVAAWGENTEDGKLLIGRNFDFYVGDEFAENKVVSFVRPEEGIPFMSYSWPGMVGVISGMNLEGLTVTMNAGKSSIPFSARTPISIVAREILQHASCIEEAISIAQNAKVFVSESLMIGSARDKKAVLIELSPKKVGIYEVFNESRLLCTNHFQSQEYTSDKRNIKHIQESHTQYRYDRLNELLENEDPLNAQKLAAILRNKEGLGGENIGMGNDKSLAHLLAHHAIIFKPEDRLVWVSSSPYQLGEFVAYDLKKIFAENNGVKITKSKEVDSLLLPRDQFLEIVAYKQYEEYRLLEDQLERAIKSKTNLEQDSLTYFVSLNPNLWRVYYLTGKYWYIHKNYQLAAEYLEVALSKEIPTTQEREEVNRLLRRSKK